MVRTVSGKCNQKLTDTDMEMTTSTVSFREFLWIGGNLVEEWNYTGIADNASMTPIILSRVTSFANCSALQFSVPAGLSGNTR